MVDGTQKRISRLIPAPDLLSDRAELRDGLIHLLKP